MIHFANKMHELENSTFFFKFFVKKSKKSEKITRN